MSRGFGASCRKAAEDNKSILYEYKVYNQANENWRDMLEMYDGIILIDKSIENGEFKNFSIDNCSNAFSLSEEGIDLLAIRLVYHLYIKYKEQGAFPEVIDLNY